MPYQGEDKENACISPVKQRRYDAVDKNESKVSNSKHDAEAKDTKKGAFSRLLQDVTNTLRNDLDHMTAVRAQDDDATSIIKEWMSEQRDSRLAAKIAKDMEVEYQDKRRSELTQGQATAIRCALEERKRIQLESLARCEVEAKDAAFARSAHEEEAAFLAKCSRDDDFARQLHDEQYAEQMQEYEEKEALLLKEQLDLDSAADEKIARQHQEEFEKEFSVLTAKQEEDDFQIANQLEKKDRLTNASERTFLKEQEEHDFKISHRLDRNNMRSEHRLRKFNEMIGNGIAAISVKDLWIRADPIVEDVMDGICISILLPNIKVLNVKLVTKRSVTVEAERFVGKDEEPGTSIDSLFDIDFDIEGKPVVLTQKDISYEYSSDNGMLHIYIENVHLENNIDNKSEYKNSNSLPILKSVKAQFSRIFFGVKN